MIGAGRFGRFVAQTLHEKGYEVVVADRRRVRIRGVRRVPTREAARTPIVLLALPVREIPPLLRQIAPSLRAGTLLVNLAAVQELPARWMREALPASIDLVGLHALFGPSSAHGGRQGRRAVLCAVRIAPARLRRVRSALRVLGIRATNATCTEHDRAMARTLFVTQLVGRALAPIVPRSGIMTANAESLARLIAASTADPFVLLADLYRFNRHTHAVARRIVSRVKGEHARMRRAR